MVLSSNSHQVLVDPTLAQLPIDQQIADYEKAIRKLKTARNTHSHISQLPLEVLALIFQYLKRPTHTHRRKDRGWLTVLRVCRAWHQLALDTPRLWSHITLSERSHEELLIKRSKSTPLQVVADIFGVEASVIGTLAAIVGRETYRLTHLKVDSARHAEMLAFLEGSSCTSAPKLEHLDLHNRTHGDAHSQESMNRLPWDLPSLRHLTIMLLPPPLPFPVSPSLTELIIETPDGSNDQLGVVAVVRMLSQHPLLERVELEQLSALDDDELISNQARILQAQPSTRISLSRLKLLKITSHDIRQLRIFKYLDFPGTARLLLNCKSSPPGGDEPIDASSVTTAWTSVAVELARMNPPFRFTSSTIANLPLGNFSVCFRESNHKDTPALSLSHPHPITPFLEAINLFSPTVTKLTLSDFNQNTAEAVGSLLRIFDEVRTLVIENCHPQILEDLLPPDGSETLDHDPNSMDLCLPKLKWVFFLGYQLYEESLRQGEKHENIMRLIESRKLERVGFISCQASAEVREQLSENSLSSVLWDIWARMAFEKVCSR
ncbi:hypothetical protein ONZ45_g9137 [Pleurotus djamor]|nr:hypothetical protein ONZ45_g9137 [Pleurotus djamor]